MAHPPPRNRRRSFMTIQAPISGMLLSAAAFLLFTLFDTVSKYLSGRYSIFQIMAVEFTTATVLLLLFALWKNRERPARDAFRMNRPRLHALRCVFQILGQWLVYLALPHLSLAEFYVIIFSMPIITVAKASLFLKERAGPHIWLLLAANFAGVLIALRPDQGASLWGLLALAGAFVMSASLVVLRKMAESETAEMTTITGAAALALSAIAVAAFVYRPAAPQDLALMMLAGALFAPAQIMLTTAFRLAPAALAVPPQFLQLVYGAAAGYIVFGDVPGQWVLIGGGIVIASNAVMLFMQNGAASRIGLRS
jgi:drug/metabolite transporter (DMT)-like permease